MGPAALFAGRGAIPGSNRVPCSPAPRQRARTCVAGILGLPAQLRPRGRVAHALALHRPLWCGEGHAALEGAAIQGGGHHVLRQVGRRKAWGPGLQGAHGEQEVG